MHLCRRAALLALVLLAAAAAQSGTAHASIACPPGFTFTPLTPEQAALAPADFNTSGAVCVREQGQHLIVADNVDDDVYRYPWMLPCPGSFYAVNVREEYDPRDVNTDNYLCAKMLLVNPMTLLMVVHDNPCAWPCPPPKKLEIE
jgi:hypothetical protein